MPNSNHRLNRWQWLKDTEKCPGWRTGNRTAMKKMDRPRPQGSRGWSNFGPQSGCILSLLSQNHPKSKACLFQTFPVLKNPLKHLKPHETVVTCLDDHPLPWRCPVRPRLLHLGGRVEQASGAMGQPTDIPVASTRAFKGSRAFWNPWKECLIAVVYSVYSLDFQKTPWHSLAWFFWCTSIVWFGWFAYITESKNKNNQRTFEKSQTQ